MSAVFGFGRVAPVFIPTFEEVAREAADENDNADLLADEIQDQIDHIWTQRDYDIEDANWMPDWVFEDMMHDIMDEEAECWDWHRDGAAYIMFHECEPFADWH